MAQAASSTRGRECLRAISASRSRSQGMPIWCTQRIARVRGGDCPFDSRRVHVKRVSADVDKHWSRITIPNCVGSSDKRVTYGDHLIPRRYAGRPQCEMQCCRAIRHRTGVRRTHKLRELAFESGDLRSLSDPPRKNHSTRRIRFMLINPWFCNRNHRSMPLVTSIEGRVRGSTSEQADSNRLPTRPLS